MSGNQQLLKAIGRSVQIYDQDGTVPTSATADAAQGDAFDASGFSEVLFHVAVPDLGNMTPITTINVRFRASYLNTVPTSTDASWALVPGDAWIATAGTDAYTVYQSVITPTADGDRFCLRCPVFGRWMSVRMWVDASDGDSQLEGYMQGAGGM